MAGNKKKFPYLAKVNIFPISIWIWTLIIICYFYFIRCESRRILLLGNITQSHIGFEVYDHFKVRKIVPHEWGEIYWEFDKSTKIELDWYFACFSITYKFFKTRGNWASESTQLIDGAMKLSTFMLSSPVVIISTFLWCEEENEKILAAERIPTVQFALFIDARNSNDDSIAVSKVAQYTGISHHCILCNSFSGDCIDESQTFVRQLDLTHKFTRSGRWFTKNSEKSISIRGYFRFCRFFILSNLFHRNYRLSSILLYFYDECYTRPCPTSYV